MVKKVIDIIPPQENSRQINAPARVRPAVKSRPAAPVKRVRAANKASRYETPHKASVSSVLVKLGIVVALVLVGMFFADSKLSHAVIQVWPQTEPTDTQAKVVVDVSAKVVDKEKKIIPGMAVAVEDTITVETPATGKKDAKGKAQGVVKITNNYTAPQRLVKGTRLQAPLEKFQPALAKDEVPWYRTTEEVIVAAKSTGTVNVISDGVGEKYNIAPSVFSVPGLVGTPQYTFIFAQSTEKFKGGSLDSAPEVIAADIDNAKKDIAKKAESEIKTKLEGQVPDGYVLIPDTIKFESKDPVISAKAGDSIEKISSQLKIKASGIAYSKSDLENLGKDMLVKKASDKNLSLYVKSISITSTYGGADSASGRPSLVLVSKAVSYPHLDEIDFKKGLAEKSRDQANIFLTSQGIKEVKIQLQPLWRFNIPRELDRIELNVILE